MKKKMSLLVTFVLILGISTNALAMDNAEDSLESYKILLPETFSLDVTLDEIANSIDQYIAEHNMEINRDTEEYAVLLHNFCFSDLPDLTETELRYYQAYASVYLSGSLDNSTYNSNNSKTIGEIREENQEQSERILEAAAQAKINKIEPRFSSYNLYDARKYAEIYAITPNIEYYYFNQDCTNFASQILHAGGMQKNDDWDPNILTGAGRMHWINAGGFTQYWSLMRGFDGAVCSSVNEVKSNADVGDFISWQNKDTHSFYHVQFVQSKTADREIYCTQHTPNYYNVKFSSRVSDSKFANEFAFIIDFY